MPKWSPGSFATSSDPPVGARPTLRPGTFLETPLKEPNALCGAPGRDEDAGVDVTCELAPHGTKEKHRAAYFGLYLKRSELEWADTEPAVILRIVAEYVIESNDFGGLDANDLVTRLESAGFTLPELPEGIPA